MLFRSLRKIYRGGAIYHSGPILRNDAGRWSIVSSGPTTSIRDEIYEDKVIAAFGLRVVIGKGGMGPRTLAACKTHKAVYDDLTTDNPIDLTRWQVANCYMGRIGLINSGGASAGADDLAQAVRTAVINKRAGGLGLISGRKAFQRPTAEGVELLNAIQDVFLDDAVTIA